MKKAYILLLIATFALPAVGYAASDSVIATVSTKTAVQTAVVETTDINSPLLRGKTLSGKKTAVLTALSDIYSQLIDLSTQTQSAVNQLNANGVVTDDAQTALISANTSLSKAKIDIAAFGDISVGNTRFSSFTLDSMKNSAATAENSLHDAKNHLLDTLALLKASLPTLDSNN